MSVNKCHSITVIDEDPSTEKSKTKTTTLVLIVICSILVKALTIGTMRCLDIFFLPFQKNLEANTRETAVVNALFFGLISFGAPVATVLCNLLGYRNTMLVGSIMAGTGVAVSSLATSIWNLYITLSVFAGLGCCLTTLPVTVLLGRIFTTKRPLVNNLSVIGPPFITAPLILLVQYWIDLFGWRGSILLLSGVVIHVIPVILFLTIQVKNIEVKIEPESDRKLFNFSLLKNIYFVLYSVANSLQCASKTLFYAYLIRYAQYLGINNYKAASLATMTSIVEISFKVLFGFILSREKIGQIPINRLIVFITFMLYQTCVVLSIPYARTFTTLFVSALTFSVGSGSLGALPTTLIGELFGPENLLDSLGLRSLFVGSFIIASPPIAGLFVDLYGSYAAPFYASSILAFLSSIVLIVILITFKRT